MFLNKAFIIGNLTRDPELKALPNGTKVASFGVATNRVYKDKDGNRQEAADFHNVVAYARLGELVAQYMKKGSQVLVEGRIQNRSWDAQDGTKRYRSEIIAENIQFGSRGGSSGAKGASASSASSADAPAEDPSKDGDAPKDAVAGEAIEYPKDDINPDDIPF